MTEAPIKYACPDCDSWHDAKPNAAYEDLKIRACRSVDESVSQVYEDYSIGKGDGRWDIDDDTATIRFTNARGIAAARFGFVGSYARKSDSFKWGWDHPSTTDLNRGPADRAREKGEAIDSDILRHNLLHLPEDETWHLAKITAYLSDMPATYRVPASAPEVPEEEKVWWYIAFDQPVWEGRA